MLSGLFFFQALSPQFCVMVNDEKNLTLKSIDEINGKFYKNKFSDELIKTLSHQTEIIGKYLGIDDEELIV